MQLSEYQERAQATDQRPGREPIDLAVPLLGLAGEVGSLLVEFKKFLRDGDSHEMFREEMTEELGDALWYLANIATKHDIDLDEAATANLVKTQERWVGTTSVTAALDSSFPDEEQLPRRFEVEFTERTGEAGVPVVSMVWDGESLGDPLTDNAHDEDGYRFHDVFHLSHAAILGWSPVLRSLMRRKRKSDPTIDETEDGGRAIVIDEAIVAFVFEHARRHSFFENVDHVDYELLRTIMNLVAGLEANTRSAHQWEQAILAGYRVWRELRDRGSGRVLIDMDHELIELL